MNVHKNPKLVCFLILAFIASWSFPASAPAQEWVKEMFAETNHDFGNVPRGAKAEFEFKLQNKYEETVHISSVRSSCGCTLPRIKTADLKTYEEGSIICEFNTQAFIGNKSAVVTVVFTKPFYGEMQLNVRGNIRSDIVTEPGLIEFGEVDGGQEKVTQVKVYYTGNKPWEIKDVRSANKNLAVKLEPAAANGRKGYVMTVKLKDNAPAGDFVDQIVLVTNDPEYNLVTIPVSGTIMLPLQMPVSVELGTVKVGTRVTSRMVVRGKEDFEVTQVECEDKRFTFTLPTGKKKVHVIPVAFDCGPDEGAFRNKVTVTTTLVEGGIADTIIGGNVIK
jgi:hypothetical protein